MFSINSWVFNDFPQSVQSWYNFHLQLYFHEINASIPRPRIPRNNLLDPKTYSLCGISSSWSARTLPSSASKIVIKNPNKILWSIASTALLSFPLISTGTLNTTTREVVSMACYRLGSTQRVRDILLHTPFGIRSSRSSLSAKRIFFTHSVHCAAAWLKRKR